MYNIYNEANWVGKRRRRRGRSQSARRYGGTPKPGKTYKDLKTGEEFMLDKRGRKVLLAQQKKGSRGSRDYDVRALMPQYKTKDIRRGLTMTEPRFDFRRLPPGDTSKYYGTRFDPTSKDYVGHEATQYESSRTSDL